MRGGRERERKTVEEEEEEDDDDEESGGRDFSWDADARHNKGRGLLVPHAVHHQKRCLHSIRFPPKKLLIKWTTRGLQLVYGVKNKFKLGGGKKGGVGMKAREINCTELYLLMMSDLRNGRLSVPPLLFLHRQSLLNRSFLPPGRDSLS